MQEFPDPYTISNSVVSVGSISTIWSPIKSPDSFAISVTRCNNGLNYSMSGLYSHISVYFLLGDKSNAPVGQLEPAVPVSKGKQPKGGNNEPAAAISLVSQEPILTKMAIPRVDVVYLEKKLRDVREMIIESELKRQQLLINKWNREFGFTFCLFLELFSGGIISTNVFSFVESEDMIEVGEFSCSIVEDSVKAGVFTAHFYSRKGGNKSSLIVLPIKEGLINQLADVLCPERALNSVVDNDVCSLLRVALGYL
jgi:hypothetical protein